MGGGRDAARIFSVDMTGPDPVLTRRLINLCASDRRRTGNGRVSYRTGVNSAATMDATRYGHAGGDWGGGEYGRVQGCD